MATGVRIVDDPVPLGDELPAMDVPVFVGFAARGPLQRAVALDSAAAYTAVFGGVLDLVQAGDDPAERLVAHLPAAVAAFFAGGGRRCHVIRVAGAKAVSTRLRLPGVQLMHRDSNGKWALRPVELLANSPGPWADRLELSARVSSEALGPDDRIGPGELLRARPLAGSGAPRWRRVDAEGTLAQAIAAGGWFDAALQPAAVDPQGWLFERLRLELALREPGQPQQRLTDGALVPGAGGLPWLRPDADALYDAGADLTGWPLAGIVDLPPGDDWLLLPLGATEGFDTWLPAIPGDGDALERLDLATFDAQLFFDGAWSPGLRGPALMRWADEIRFFGAQPRRLQGLHGALGRDDACAAEASWVLVPDAVHPGWQRTEPPPPRAVLVTTTPDPACECPPPVFALCAPPPPRPPQVPQVPRLGVRAEFEALGPGWPAGQHFWLRLRTDPADGGAPQTLEVQLAGQPDFSDARVIANAQPMHDVKLALAAGLQWMRARAHRLGLSSGWSAPLMFDVRAHGWRARPAQPAEAEPGVATRVNVALLALAAASREHVALLSLPLHWDGAQVGAHVAALRAEAERVDSAQAASAASFAAVHHPWLLQRDADGRLRRHPPSGALIGSLARRSRQHGAWGAPGLEPLGGALALAGELQSPELIEALGANALALRHDGIAALRGQTLSVDADWNALGVRRLFILLRRLCRREGRRFVFEPNDLTLRRGLERSFDALLHRLMQRGAFRGTDARSSYLLKTAAGAEALREIERGECSLLIQVAPSRPLRFLTLHLRRSGEQLVIEER